jgi:hypothetical protein
MLTNEEYQEATDRLTAWCADEGLQIDDAAVIFIKLCGSIVAELAGPENLLDEGIAALETILRSTARQRASAGKGIWVN